MTTRIGGGEDPAFLDDVLIKEGSLGKWESRLGESPSEWFDGWEPTDPSATFTADSDQWRAHYRSGYPLVFYHNRNFVFGVRKEYSLVTVDKNTDDIVWAKMDGNVVLERGDYPRFTTRDLVKFSHTPNLTEIPNVFRLNNGFSIACSKEVTPVEFGARTEGEAWWMIGPTEEEEELSRRVLMIKIYDGPYKYQSRGTDIILSDPAPLDSKAEYVMYSYNEEGIKSLYREVYEGVAPQKHAMTIRGQEMLDQMVSFEGSISYVNDQIVGPGKVKFSFPLDATKLLKVEHRGSEVISRINPDHTDWVDFQNYDGLAVTELEVEFDIVSSLASFRVEWESLRDWKPVGRPKIDILPAGWGGNLIRLEVDEGEGLVQSNSLYTGAYTVSANVKCIEGQALIEVGGHDIVNWNPLDKSIRGAGDFVANNDIFDFTLTGRGRTIFEIDRFRVAEAGQTEWVPQDMQWYVETESGKFPASESINNEQIPVGLGEARQWRIGVEMPEEMGETEEVAISAVYNETFQTGAQQLLREIRWSGEGQSRVGYPQNIVSLPFPGNYIPIESSGAITWEQQGSSDIGDVKLLLDGSPVAYRSEYTYRPVTLKNRRWRVDIEETRATIFLDDKEVGIMEGQGLPFRVVQNNSEDIQLDCASGFIQLRRELGPRFEGWTLGYTSVNTARSGPRTAWGITVDEAEENLPFYVVRINR